MKLLFRIAAIAVFAGTLLAGGDALAGGRRDDHDGDRGRDRREWRPDPRELRRDREPPPGRRWREGPPEPYVVQGPPDYARHLPPPNYGLRRGGLVPPEYRGAVVPDYGRLRLRPPPPGFAWVRMGGRYMLVSRATGQIFDVIGDR